MSPPIHSSRVPRPGVKDVAAVAGVSASTVSNFLNRPDVVIPQTRARIERAIRQLGFVRNETARHLRAGTSRTIALVLLDAWIPFYSELSRGVEDAAAADGWTVLFSNSARNPERELRNLDIFESQRVAGLLVVPQQDLRSRLRDLQRHGISCVTIEQPSTADDISSVSIDDIAGGRAAGRHLIDCGYSDVLLIGNPAQVSHVRARFAGCEEVIKEQTGRRCRLIPTEGLTLRDGAEAVTTLLESEMRLPEAIFAANDLVALGVLHALLAAGIGVPDQIAVLGYDGLELAAHASVPLSTIAQPAYEMGKVATQTLIACMNGTEQPGQRHQVFQPTVIRRESTRVAR